MNFPIIIISTVNTVLLKIVSVFQVVDLEGSENTGHAMWLPILVRKSCEVLVLPVNMQHNVQSGSFV